MLIGKDLVNAAIIKKLNNFCWTRMRQKHDCTIQSRQQLRIHYVCLGQNDDKKGFAKDWTVFVEYFTQAFGNHANTYKSLTHTL